jgi:hypothetical protein
MPLWAMEGQNLNVPLCALCQPLSARIMPRSAMFNPFGERNPMTLVLSDQRHGKCTETLRMKDCSPDTSPERIQGCLEIVAGLVLLDDVYMPIFLRLEKN